MSLSYTIRESLAGFTRTKFSTAMSIVTIGISLLLLGLFAVASLHATRFIDALRSRVEMEAFLLEPLSPEVNDRIRLAIRQTEGVDSLTFVSKDDAARIFREEFGDNILDVLEFNPLPPSYKITLLPAYKTADRARSIHDQLAGIEGVESVRYRKALLELIDRRTTTVNNLTLGLGILISLSAVLLVSNTIRLAIYARRKIIRTMELVGATRLFIRTPFLLEGMLQGLLGGCLAAGILYLLLVHAVRWLSQELAGYLAVSNLFFGAVVLGGVALGLAGSLISVARFIRPER
jgi:cell division transport system permease protein